MNSPPHRVYLFEDFRLDTAARELRRAGEEVALQPRALDVLTYLIEHRDQAVSRDELIAAVWESEHIADSVLGHVIFMVRRALDDSGDEPRFIKTVRRFGYRWAAAVQEESAALGEPDPPQSRRQRLRWISLAAVAGLLVLLLTLLWPQRQSSESSEFAWHAEAGEIALVLPVNVKDADRHPWIRLGVMDLIAERLRGAGQAVVPSDTVIALLREHDGIFGAEDIAALVAATGAGLVLQPHASGDDSAWTVMLRSLHGPDSPLVLIEDAGGVIDAASGATDRLAVSLGLKPAPPLAAEPDLALLQQRADAAMLARQTDVARELIESADEALRADPRIRLRYGLNEYYSRNYDKAEEILRPLLELPLLKKDVLLRGRVLHGLGAVRFNQGDSDDARRLLDEAAQLLSRHSEGFVVLGGIYRALGMLDLIEGRLDTGSVYLAQSRRILEASGDARGLALLDNNQGILAVLQDRFPTALFYLERAARRSSVINSLGDELQARANLAQAQLYMLDIHGALAGIDEMDRILSRVNDPASVGMANAVKSAIFDAAGQDQAAGTALDAALQAMEGRDELRDIWSWAMIQQIERASRRGDLAVVIRDAQGLLDALLPGAGILLDDTISRAWLMLTRAHLGQGDWAVASEISARFDQWAVDRPAGTPRILAALGRAETALAQGLEDAAEAAYEQALALADVSRIPIRMLEVAESHVPWLLDGRDPERALAAAERVAEFAESEFRAAVLQLRVYHSLGPVSAWRAALNRAEEIAREREIPPELLEAPR